MELKKATFAELGAVTRPDCVLASNTSTLDIDEFAQASGRPAQVIGHHFFSPAQRDEAARDRARPRDQQGSDRHVAEARRSGSARSASSSATASGSSPTACSPTTCARPTCCSRRARASPQIDQALTEFGMPVGPFGMQDIAGIDVGARIRQYLAVDRQDARRGPAVGGARSAVRDGSLRPEDRRRLVHATKPAAAPAFPIRWSSSSPRKRPPGAASRAAPIADEEIIARITTALANEGARVLEEGYAIARRRHRRHLLLRLRLSAPSRRADVLRRHRRPRRPCWRASTNTGARFGDYWEPAPLLERLVAEGRGFYATDRRLQSVIDDRPRRGCARRRRPGDRGQRLGRRDAGAHRRVRRRDRRPSVDPRRCRRARRPNRRSARRSRTAS